MKITAATGTDVGLKRKNNEDKIHSEVDKGLFIVCDGMGGHSGGEVAAEEAAEEISASIWMNTIKINTLPSVDGGPNTAERVIADAINSASRSIYKMATADESLAGMGCTASLLLFNDEKAIMGHIGDSRVYLRRGGSIELLSRDHTVAREASPEIDDFEINRRAFSNVLTRCVGMHEAVVPDTLTIGLLPGDTFLICSDGLSNYFESYEQIEEIISGADLNRNMESLLQFARAAGGEDNISAIIVRVEGGHAKSIEAAKELLKLMKTTPLFDSATLSQRTRITEACQTVEFDKNQEIVSRETSCGGFYVVLNGKLSLIAGNDSEELEKGDYFGEVALIRDRVSDIRIVGVEAGQVLYLSREAFEGIALRWPRLARKLQRNLLLNLTKKNRLPIL